MASVTELKSRQSHSAVSGLIPARQQRHEELMSALMGSEGSDPASLFGTPKSSSPSAGMDVDSCIDM